jgi:hypothetical protein
MKRKYIYRVLLINFVIFYSSSNLYAGDFYIGIRDTYMSWWPGAANKQKEIAVKRSMAMSYIFQYAYSDPTLIIVEEPSISNGQMNMGGITLSYVSDTWSMNYSGSYGKTSLDFGEKVFNSQGKGASNLVASYSTPMTVERQDHELLFSKLMGNSGFFIFAGAKHQSYKYNKPLFAGQGFGWGTENFAGDRSNSPIVLFTGTNSSFFGTGPALGIGYNFALTDRQSVSLSLGGISMKGAMDNSTKALFNYTSNFSSLSNNTLTRYYGFDSYEKLILEGGTADITYNLKFLDSFILRLSARYQEGKYRSLSRDSIVHSAAKLNSLPAFYIFLPDFIGVSPGFGGARDRFEGISIAIVAKI